MVNVRQVWDWLGQIPDPEIPVLSLTDLGVIRDVRFDGDTLVVAVTPTYSGCPATAIINLDIETALRARGVEKLKLERRAVAAVDDRLDERGRPAQAARIRHRAAGRAASACPRCDVAAACAGSASSVRRRARPTTLAKIAWSRSTISSASDEATWRVSCRSK